MTERQISPDKNIPAVFAGTLRQSHRAHDKRVVGVISRAGDFKQGILLEDRENFAGNPT